MSSCNKMNRRCQKDVVLDVRCGSQWGRVSAWNIYFHSKPFLTIVCRVRIQNKKLDGKDTSKYDVYLKVI